MTQVSVRRFHTLLLSFYAILGLTVAASAPAFAHSQLINTDPFDGEQAERAPEYVTLTFNEDIVELGTQMHVAGPDGETISVGDAVVEGPQVKQQLADVRPKGAYVVTWRVVSADGHPLSGEYTFTASADFPVVEEDDVSDETTDAATEDPTDTPESEDQDQLTGPVPTVEDSGDATSADVEADTARSPWRVAILVVLGLGAIGGIIARVVILRRNQK